ncbi:hypothetical protein MP228_011090 [Amoeboaphelidium protococcarum]|nr:hypothetical protein MP228_011090 [Amoeboaphelidium protococcarum]
MLEEAAKFIVPIVLVTVVAGFLFGRNNFQVRQAPKLQSIPSSEKKQGESAIYRHPKTPHGGPLLKGHPQYPEVTTFYEGFQSGVKKAGARHCMGTRVGDGPYVWETYSEIEQRVKALGSGLRELGLISERTNGQDIKGTQMVGIYAKNCSEWLITQIACSAYSFVVVPLYDTLGHDAIKYIINQAELSVVIVEPGKLQNLLQCANSCPSLKYVVKMGSSLTPEEKQSAKQLSPSVSLMYFKGVEALGKENLKPVVPAKPDDLLTICYTSGTTGDPKGVMITHENIVAEAAGVFSTFPEDLVLDENELHLSFLPLAHIFEQLIAVAILTVGGAVAFYRGDVLKLLDDLQFSKPTVFPAVPRLLNRVHDKIWQTVNEASAVRRFIFKFALEQKRKLLRRGIVTKDSFWDKLVFNKIQARLGGRVKLMVSGAAPISHETIEFFRIVFGCEVLEGYGQTETAAAVVATCVGDYSFEYGSHVGCVLPCNEIKLVDAPELDYLSTDKPHPRGEVCVRGYNVFKGYYKMPDKTAETLIDGWNYSGDIGMFLPNGTLKIIDRKKNLFKLAQGEYISPEKIENVYVKCHLIEQCFVYGNSLEHCLIGVVIPDEECARKWARDNGKPADVAALCQDPQFKQALVKEMKEQAKQAKLHSFEQLKDFIVDHEKFTVENNLLTPSFKLKRKETKQKYESQLNDMYQKMKQK